MRNEDAWIITQHRFTRLNKEHPGQAFCRICKPYRGENFSLRKRRKRTDAYKNHRRNFSAQRAR